MKITINIADEVHTNICRYLIDYKGVICVRQWNIISIIEELVENTYASQPIPVPDSNKCEYTENLIKNDILLEADKIINGERNLQYGEPEDSFKKIGKYWSQYLQDKVGLPIDEISSHDVAMMMILLKVARTDGDKKKRDNYVDIAGYAALAGRL
jgi:hypothetical protein